MKSLGYERIPQLTRIAGLGVWAILLFACEPGRAAPPMRQVPGGDVELGREAILRYGCGGCHVIPGVREARGLVAPPLTHYGRRGFVGGVVSNSRKPDKVDRRSNRD